MHFIWYPLLCWAKRKTLRLLHPTGFAFWRKFLNLNLCIRKLTFRKNLKNQLRMFSHTIQKVISELVFYLVKKDCSQTQVEIKKCFRKIASEQSKDDQKSHQYLVSEEIKLPNNVHRFGYPLKLHACHDLRKREN